MYQTALENHRQIIYHKKQKKLIQINVSISIRKPEEENVSKNLRKP